VVLVVLVFVTGIARLVQAGDNAAVTGANALIRNAIVFTLSGIPSGCDPSPSISNVSWQYGTALNEPNIPEPASLVLVAMGGLLAIRRH
jgi:hypothetical protein